MLKLKEIKKQYIVGDSVVHALKGINLSFRENEFVAVLGHSGCGKTTLLNIIGGLDQYSSGDLVINGKSTKNFTDGDWDAYRNHSIGFVFQSYNLIPHQTVLSNVELALTLSGVAPSERRARAVEALEKVGLADQINKKPNQMSGGQMQRVAIARALVNDPNILLADEPTGALDSKTSEQVMDLMHEVAKDRLVIMVTHNPDLAERYSSRIIRLFDGKITGDTDPYIPEAEKSEEKASRRAKMGFLTALSLSLNNLLTKKTRTFLTAFAGSIGIIGIALILSLSNGVSQYISRLEESTLSSYPLTITRETTDFSELLKTMTQPPENAEEHEDGKVYSMNILSEMFNTILSDIKVNNLTAFKAFLDDPENGFSSLTSGIQYTYATEMYIYSKDANGQYVQANPNNLFEAMGSSPMMMGMTASDLSSMGYTSSTTGTSIFTELIENPELLGMQYDVLAGRLPQSYDELVLIVSPDDTINDMALYSLGLKDRNELKGIMLSAMTRQEIPTAQTEYSYEELLGLDLTLVINSDFYERTDEGTYVDVRSDPKKLEAIVDNGVKLRIVGIVRPNEESVSTLSSGVIGYTNGLSRFLISSIADSQIVKAQLEDPETDVFTGSPMADAGTSSEANLARLGWSDLDSPYSINIFPKDFSSKAKITAKINEYNDRMEQEDPDSVISYTDFIDIMMSSVNTIIEAISYVLIAFVAISLIVSSIMIGIITYISVLERTKEIGILRAIGASKRDIAHVFNAETIIVGFTAGMIGILFTQLAIIPINALIKYLTDISNAASLPLGAAVVLVLISMFLTYIAGLIPAGIARRKDPVVALRSE